MTKKCVMATGGVLSLFVFCAGINAIAKSFGADADSKWLQRFVSVATIEMFEGMEEAYKGAHLKDGVTPLDSGPWSDADRVRVTAAALLGTMEKTSRDTWQPGYEEFLRGLEFSDEQIRAAVFFAYAQQAVQISDAVFVALGKPAP